jgi:hypothetical protein
VAAADACSREFDRQMQSVSGSAERPDSFIFSEGELQMPVVFIDAPPGIHADAKRKMMEKITSAIDEAYHIGDTLVFLREHAIDNVAMDGRIQSENPKILDALKKVSG